MEAHRHRADLLQSPFLGGAPGVVGRLTYYAPRHCQPDHEHAVRHVSILLAGEFTEVVRGAERERTTGATLRRDPGARHAVRFGHAGALIMTFEAGGASAPFAGDEAAFCREFGRRAQDMLAAPVSERPLEERPPGWLMVAKRRLADDPGVVSVERLAAECGLHRVHFSRSFTAHLGVRPSVFRRRSMVARALALTLIDGLPLAEAALAAGFADQAHLTRAVRGICGMPLGRLRALLAA